MIAVMLLVVISLFAFYNIILLIFPLKKNVFFKNEERAEEFVYSKQSYSTVMVGSGLIGDFSAKRFQRVDLFNLYFPYSGSCTGVEIIALSGKVPQILLVETNYLFKGFDTKLVNNLFKSPLYKMRFLLPSLLKKHHLFPLIKELVRPARPMEMKKHKLPDSLYQQSLNNYKYAYDQLPDIKRYSDDLEKLKKYLDYIRLKGCDVFFLKCH